MPSASSIQRRRRRVIQLVVGLALVAGTCGLGACGDGGADPVGDARAEQARVAARAAGLSDDAAEVLARAARAATATYTVAYGTDQQVDVVIRQDGPDRRRVDIVVANQVTSVNLVVDGRAYECDPSSGADAPADARNGEPTARLRDCDVVDEVVDGPGPFRAAAVDDLVSGLAARLGEYDVAVESRTIADTDARCLVLTVRPSASDPGLVDAVLCISDEGVLLLADQAGERLVAVSYEPSVDSDVFRRPT